MSALVEKLNLTIDGYWPTSAAHASAANDRSGAAGGLRFSHPSVVLSLDLSQLR
jgi:hypothetical protein